MRLHRKFDIVAENGKLPPLYPQFLCVISVLSRLFRTRTRTRTPPEGQYSYSLD